MTELGNMYETQEDVFEDVMDELTERSSDYIDLLKNPTDQIATSKIVEFNRNEFNRRFANALPFDFPPIPQTVERYIKHAKSKSISLVTVMAACYKADKFVKDPDAELVWINCHPDEFAVAWLMTKEAKS